MLASYHQKTAIGSQLKVQGINSLLDQFTNAEFGKIAATQFDVLVDTVTRDWRMTFGLNDEGALVDMDLEDYHGA